MKKNLILLSEYCEKSRAELDFLTRLKNEGLIEMEVQNNNYYLQVSQLNDLERFIRLYYDLSINIEGIDVINNLLGKINHMEHELSLLRRRLNAGSFLEDDSFIDES